jgi:hypothetical protein
MATDKQLREASACAEKRQKQLQSDRVQLKADLKRVKKILADAEALRSSLDDIAYRYEHKAYSFFSEMHAMNISSNAKKLLTNIEYMLDVIDRENERWKNGENIYLETVTVKRRSR